MPKDIIKNALMDVVNRKHRWASLVIVQAEDTGRILVVGRKKDGQIGLPCGKQDPGEGPYTTAMRELYEETGLNACELEKPVRYLTLTEFEGCYVSVFSSTIKKECPLTPAEGFEDETEPFWIEIDKLVNTESHFQSFNIVALFNAGLYK